MKWRTALSSGNMWVFLFQQFTSAFADNLYVFYIPMFLLIEKGVDTAQAGILASLPLFGAYRPCPPAANSCPRHE